MNYETEEQLRERMGWITVNLAEHDKYLIQNGYAYVHELQHKTNGFIVSSERLHALYKLSAELWAEYNQYSYVYACTPFILEIGKKKINGAGFSLKSRNGLDVTSSWVLTLDIDGVAFNKYLQQTHKFRFGNRHIGIDHLHLAQGAWPIPGTRFYVSGHNSAGQFPGRLFLRHVWSDHDNPKTTFDALVARDSRTAPCSIQTIPFIPNYRFGK